MNAATLAVNGKAKASEKWLQHSVKEFFTAINWEQHPPEIHEIKQATIQGSDRPIPLTLSVGQFLNCIPWEGVKTAESTPQVVLDLEGTTTAVSDFTLDDFSSLF